MTQEYGVDDGNGQQITIGVSRSAALRVAQEHATRTGAAVSVYPVPVRLDADGEAIDESEIVGPITAELADSYTTDGWRGGEREALADVQMTVGSLRRLRTEAAEAGDLTMVATVDRAADGDVGARAECVRVLRAAQAQESA